MCMWVYFSSESQKIKGCACILSIVSVLSLYFHWFILDYTSLFFPYKQYPSISIDFTMFIAYLIQMYY